jgi:hypothetical protein
VIVDKRNAIHYENMSQALANSLANKTNGFVHEMAFGNGGTSVDPTGIITYLTPNSTGTNASLYNQTYYKVIDDNSATNKDTTRNKMEVRHTAGNKYTDIVCTCTLDYGEPTGQAAFRQHHNFNGDYVFRRAWIEELGRNRERFNQQTVDTRDIPPSTEVTEQTDTDRLHIEDSKFNNFHRDQFYSTVYFKHSEWNNIRC